MSYCQEMSVKIIEIPAAKKPKFPWRDYLIAVLIFAGMLAAAVVIATAVQMMGLSE